MDAIEKIRDVWVSIHPGYMKKNEEGTYKRQSNVHKLVIPSRIVEKLKLEKGRVATLMISPPIDTIVDGENFDLIYHFGKFEMKAKDKEWEEVKVEDYVEEEETPPPDVEVDVKELKGQFDLGKVINGEVEVVK